MRIVFACGGTAGHINPAIAIANYIKEKEPESEFLFIGTKEGMESTLVPKQGYEIKYIKIQGFKRSLDVRNIGVLYKIYEGTKKAKKIIKEFNPDVVLGTGGYVSGPVLLAASRLKYPTLIHESNAFPGVTVRILAKIVDMVAVSMEEAIKFLNKKAKVVVTGNPVRPSILSVDKEHAKKTLNLDSRKTILISGGSLGAKKINSVSIDWISEIAKERKYQIIMSTGRNSHIEDAKKQFEEKGIKIEEYPEIRVSEYIYDMDLCLNAADLIVSRSGGSVSEMTALGKAMVLIPSPYVAGNHQEHNARAVEKGGGAVVILEKDLTVQSLGDTVKDILEDGETLIKMSNASKSLGIPDSTEKIYRILREMTGK